MLGVDISTVAGRLMMSLLLGRRPHDLGDRVADLERHLQFGAGEALGRILEAIASTRPSPPCR
jgi:hypothetical protein